MFIEQLEVTGVGCVRMLRAQLTPIHAFIGPNDSGKSTLLRAIQSIFIRSRSAPEVGHLGQYGSRGRLEQSVRFVLSPGGYQVGVTSGGDDSGLRIDLGKSTWSDWDSDYGEPNSAPPDTSPLLPPYNWLQRGARFVRWEADALRQQSPLIPESSNAEIPSERGHGLAGIYDLIFNRGDEARDRIQGELRRLFPTVQRLRLRNVTVQEKELVVQLVSGATVKAAAMSEGLLYYLAFAAIQYLEPAAVLLVEEPENGLHPSRIADVMRILREISKSTQVVMATHSPLVINELNPGEVTVITRDSKEGTQARALQETPNFAERSKVYALGELWLSYANGEDEAPLFLAEEGAE